jgi:uncharacterized protein
MWGIGPLNRSANRGGRQRVLSGRLGPLARRGEYVCVPPCRNGIICAMISPIAQSRMPISAETLACFCRKWGIQKLELFGSVLRDDYRPDSDIDLLYTPAPHSRWGLGFVRLRAELEGLLGKRVDLVAREAVERSHNPIRREAILSSTQVFYEA